jgi:hypothetical protein
MLHLALYRRSKVRNKGTLGSCNVYISCRNRVQPLSSRDGSIRFRRRRGLASGTAEMARTPLRRVWHATRLKPSTTRRLAVTRVSGAR